MLAVDDLQAAEQYATEGLDLARQCGAPYAITMNLVATALALAADDPTRARALLDEAAQLATTAGYESPNELMWIAFTGARLGDWRIALHAITRTLHYQLRSGSIPTNSLTMLQLAPRGLAENDPEAAATIQGGIRPLLARLTAPRSGNFAERSLARGGFVAFVLDVRHAATELLVHKLGEQRLRELRAIGEHMEPDDLYSYARMRINAYLATATP